ncbi:MAG TPA: S8 family serine peptidase [Casimicrobiaceae bacterium]|nr:S8 family serine peptidase [Casimicrobiaceae bacterium]
MRLTRLERLALFVLFALLAPNAGAETISHIRVMLHPYAADAGQLPAAALTRLEALAGQPLALAGTTRTGGLELDLEQALDRPAAAAMLRRLQVDRSVLWVEAVSDATSAPAPAVASGTGDKLMLRLAGDPAPDWASLLPRWSALVGAPLAVDHRSGNVWVLRLAAPIAQSQLGAMASRLEVDPAVQYADPVRRATVKLVPDDPDYAQQWALSDLVAGIDAPAGWDLQTGSASTVVAVVDTGITQHPELAGRVLPGYDLISDSNRANDGDGRDNDASDPGDATSDGECGPGFPGEASTWHGTYVSGIIAADSNNGAGIAGINWNAKILPVRVLGKCGGTFDDIAAGVLWAAGLPVPGVPDNPNPAKVINMSLGGATSCPQALQDAIDVALAQGTVITVAAGNESGNASDSAPANCSGVITVGAGGRNGDRASYSNFGVRVDISAPGGDGSDPFGLILSLSNDGKTSPGNPSYRSAAGTSAAAPHVAGVASLMLARNANLTPGHVLDIIGGTARLFAGGATCGNGPFCGTGLLDMGLALESTFPADSIAPQGAVPVIEYYRADKDHYFMTADPNEAAFVDAALAGTFQRTGEVFYAWLDPAKAPPNAVPVCRFYSPLPLIDSHFYTAFANECDYVIAHYPGVWFLETRAAFYVLPADAAGNCAAGELPVYRFFDNRADANHRHTIDLSVRRAMLNRKWAPEGIGPNAVAFCSPI